jgi:hypothetical protein
MKAVTSRYKMKFEMRLGNIDIRFEADFLVGCIQKSIG